MAPMRQSNFRPIVFSFLCFSLALVLTVIGLPDWMDQWRPLWMLLVMLFWFLAAPNNVGLVAAFIAGLALDLLLGDPLGVNALCFCVVILICHFQYLRFRSYTELQRAWFVAVLVVIYQTCYLLLQSMVGSDMSFSIVFAPALTSSIGWLPLSAVMSRLQRRFGVI
jgi:rod shape-determining protein MreD